jgi:CRP-like cAMP-binding protein
MKDLSVMRNRILSQFAEQSPEAYARFAQSLDPVTFKRGEILGTAKSRPSHVYFVDGGIVSLVATTSAGHSLDVAIVGTEGVTGIVDALGANALPYSWIVQLPGTAYRAPTNVVREHILSCSDLHGLLMAYSQSMAHQLTQSAVCNRFHTALQRLARWLLLTSDRAGTCQLALTHELLAQMVGAPRSAVSQAAAQLKEDGVIDYRRGMLTITNGSRLKSSACECFDLITRALDAPAGL